MIHLLQSQETENVSTIDGCSSLSDLQGSIYSVLRHDKTLSIKLDETQYDYIEKSDTVNPDDPMCFAVNLCDGLNSPVHMQISQQMNDILVSHYLRDLDSQQWNIRLNTVSVSKSAIRHEKNVTFWNGVEIITSSNIETDVKISVDARVEFQDNPLHLALEFSGDAHINYKVSILLICITVPFILLLIL